MFAIITSSLLNLGLNFLLVPKYGFIAAALTTVVSYAFLLVLMVVISRRFFIWEFPFKSLGKVICASAIMGLVVLFIVGNGLTSSTLLNLIVGICIGTVVYLLMLLLLRELQEEEIQELRAIKAKFKRRIG